jgi:protein farnesyltransferase subunit beta
MQQAPEGGFSGRTNKLVDACYSWWVGGCWSIIEAANVRSPTAKPMWNRGTPQTSINIAALTKYLLACCQHPDGGLRDKPPMRADFYHSLYSLAGLSAAQNHYIYDINAEGDEVAFKWVRGGTAEAEEGDRVGTVHPLFVLPWGDAERIRAWFVKKGPIAAK